MDRLDRVTPIDTSAGIATVRGGPDGCVVTVTQPSSSSSPGPRPSTPVGRANTTPMHGSFAEG